MNVQARRNRSLVIALYLNAALLACILVAMLARSPSRLAYGALPGPQMTGGSNLYLMPAQFGTNRWGCYVLDTDAQTLLAYYYAPKSDGTDLELVAARKIQYDRQLTNFNSTNPSWMEVKKWVEEARDTQGQENVVPPGKERKNTTEQSKQGPN